MTLKNAALAALLLPWLVAFAAVILGLPWYVLALATIPATVIALVSLVRRHGLREKLPVELGWACGFCGPPLAGASMQVADGSFLKAAGALLLYGFTPLWLAFPYVGYVRARRMRNVAFWRRRGEKGLRQLISILEHGGNFIGSLDAAALLGELGDRRAVEPLTRVVQDDIDPVMRQAAALALGKIGDQRALSALRQMQQHDHGVGDDGSPIAEAATAAIQEIERRRQGESGLG